jgi:hypothetical protein
MEEVQGPNWAIGSKENVSKYNGADFPGVKRLGSEADHSSL